MFWFDEEALIKAQLHSVIVVVSAKRWKGEAGKELFERQIVAANKVVVSLSMRLRRRFVKSWGRN